MTVVRLLPRLSFPLTLAAAGVAVVRPFLGLGSMLAVGAFVGQVPAAVRGEGSGWTVALGIVAGCYLAQECVNALYPGLQWRLGQRLNHHLDDRAMATLLAPPGIAHLDDARTRDLAGEATDGLSAGRWRPAELPGALVNLTAGVLGILMSFVVVIWLRWWLGLVLVAATLWALHEVIRHIVHMLLDVIEVEGEAGFRRLEYERDAAVSPASAKEVRLFGFAPWVLDRWQARLIRLLALDLRRMGRIGPGVIVSVAVLAVVVGGGFGWVAVEVGRGGLSLAAGTVLAQALLAPLGQAGWIGQSRLDLALASRPVRALLDLEARIGDVTPVGSSPGVPVAADGPTRAIRFEGVSFRYPETESDVLYDFDLEIPAGSSLAVVGLNGAGKTTLVKLLCRFYDPTAGRITVDGIDLRDIEPSAWQARVAAIFSDFARLPLSAQDNVAFGAASVEQGELDSAADRAGAADLVAALPDGWATPLSRELTGGADLSGGQWQRLALARALFNADRGAGVLVLDEPAANLDIRAEAELNERVLRGFTKVGSLDGHAREPGRQLTTLVISHRFSTVRQADRICVLANGRVVEMGSHDELLASGGQYAELFRLQAARFVS